MEQDRTTLKSYFETGDIPTESQFADLIDSSPNEVDDKASLYQLFVTTIEYDLFQPNATDTGTVTIGQLPAGSVPIAAKMVLDIAFLGGVNAYSGTDLAISGLGSICTGLNTSVTPSATTARQAVIGATSYNSPSQAAPVNITATITAYQADFSPGVIDDFTSGEILVWIWYLTTS